MPLPILKVSNAPSRDDLIRYFHRTELHWTRHLTEETQFDFGAAFANADLAKVYDANQMLDAFVPEGSTAEAVYEQVNAHFKSCNSQCRKWVLSPAASLSQIESLRQHLLTNEFEPFAADILYLTHAPAKKIAEVSGLTIIPGRAAYKHARTLAQEWAAEHQTPQLADSTMLHVDGDHTDTLVAIKDDKPAAMAFVLAVGEIGAIEHFYVSKEFRNQGIGRTMMSRLMEICARSLFKHIVLATKPDNGPAHALYKNFGFSKIGEIVSYTV